MSTSAFAIMAYPDFVAAIGQENAPPGGATTLATWSEWVPERPRSRVLDLACSTGYSGRSWAGLRDDVQDVSGIDLSDQAVRTARTKAPMGGSSFDYRTGDAAALPYEDASFDVVLGGCNFAFIAEREAAAAEVARVLRPGGTLVVSNFFYTATPSDGFLDRMEHAVGFRPSAAWTRTFWDDLYERWFNRSHETVTPLCPAPRWKVLLACARAAAEVEGLDQSERLAAFRRLAPTRMLLNQHRAVQGLSLQAWVRP